MSLRQVRRVDVGRVVIVVNLASQAIQTLLYDLCFVFANGQFDGVNRQQPNLSGHQLDDDMCCVLITPPFNLAH